MKLWIGQERRVVQAGVSEMCVAVSVERRRRCLGRRLCRLWWARTRAGVWPVGGRAALVVIGRARRAESARGWRQRGQAGEGGGQGLGPGPVAGEAQGGAPGVEDQPPGGVQEPVAQCLGFAGGELVGER